MEKYPTNVKIDRGIMFFSAGSPRDCRVLMSMGIKDILVSYYYIKKNFTAFQEEILPEIKRRGGLFMTDSGGFSFINTTEYKEEYETEEFWMPYLTEYLEWVMEYRDFIYVIANLDIDVYLGREIIDRWNRVYFKPMEKLVNVVYVAHRDLSGEYRDKNGMKRFKQYLKLHDYIGVNNDMKEESSKFFSLAGIHKKRIHGFGWTSIPMLQDHPFFSVDSTTWLGGVRYGTTYLYDGANFMVKDHKHKFVRKSRKLMCRDNGIYFKGVMREEAEPLNKLNLLGWKGARRNYLRAANLKLRTKPVIDYAKNKS